MAEITLNVESRQDSGKQYAKKLKREGKIPGIYYFHGQEGMPFSVNMKDVQELSSPEVGLITILIDGKEEKKCIIREIQYDPIRLEPIHIDLMGILLTEKITVTVPVHLTGTSTGVKNSGGVLQHILREISVECFPGDIPENIEIDVTNMDIGDSLHVSDLTVENARILADDETVVATVSAPRKVEEEEVEVEEGEETAEPELISKEEKEE